MQWDAIGALSELFGAIAVVASLLYLSRQLRMTRQVDQTGTLNAVVTGFTHHVGQFFSADDDLALRGLTDRSALSESERLRFDHLLSSLVSQGEMAHHAADPGLVSDSDINLLDWWLREKLFCYPGAREWLQEFEGWYGQSYLERLRRAAAASSKT
jgi:hypothetical protein